MSDKSTLLNDTLQQANDLALKVEQLTKGNFNNTNRSILKSVVQDIVQESLSNDETKANPKKIQEMDDMDMQMDDDLGTEENYDDLPDLSVSVPDDMDTEMEDGGEAIDLRQLGDDDFLKVYKRMNPETVYKDSEGLTKIVDPDGSEYIVTTEGDTKKKTKIVEMQNNLDEMVDEPIYEIQLESDDLNDESNLVEESDEPIYEIELEPINEVADTPFKHKAPKMERTRVSKRTAGAGGEIYSETPAKDTRTSAKKKNLKARGSNKAPNILKTKNNTPFTQKPNKLKEGVKEKVEGIMKENKFLKSKLKKLETSMPVFESKLNNFAVDNTKLTYALKLMSENTTSKEEKNAIIEHFDSVETIAEAKKLYQTLQHTLSSSKVNGITDLPQLKENIQGSSNQTLEESDKGNTSKVDPYARMKELMKYNA